MKSKLLGLFLMLIMSQKGFAAWEWPNVSAGPYGAAVVKTGTNSPSETVVSFWYLQMDGSGGGSETDPGTYAFNMYDDYISYYLDAGNWTYALLTFNGSKIFHYRASTISLEDLIGFFPQQASP